MPWARTKSDTSTGLRVPDLRFSGILPPGDYRGPSPAFRWPLMGKHERTVGIFNRRQFLCRQLKRSEGEQYVGLMASIAVMAITKLSIATEESGAAQRVENLK
jgi:hypothetical protein